MKKALSILLTAALCISLLSFAGCTNTENEVFAMETERIIEKAKITPDDGVIKTFEEDSASTYINPLIFYDDKDTWRGYGVGDPFVMRYNGRYYLYCSTKDGEIGIQCWTSDDLVEWNYAGLCAEEELTMSAYAPEVVYYNGAFYMYTSPAGHGHYVLKSDTPTGPFTAVTENFGLSIDGDVFIDDDGKWYFYSADIAGIRGYTMSSPTEVDAASGVNTNSYMNGWTEGSMIIKYNGRYYMTYTGNHVWCDGYRIDYSVSEDSPLSFTPALNNPILLSTGESLNVKGIGHSSTVLGPDLDGYYIVYHSSVGVPKREMNIDRLVLNGNRLDALGPTRQEQESCDMPEVYSYFENAQDLDPWYVKKSEDGMTSAEIVGGSLTVHEGGIVLSKTEFLSGYTAEINLLSIEGEAGAYFDFRDAENYGLAVYDMEKQLLSVTVAENGEEKIYTTEVSGSFGEKLSNDALLLLTVRRTEERCEFLVNNRSVLTLENELKGGVVGLISTRGKAQYGFVGISSHVMQSGVKALAKPVQGVLPAVTCVEDGLTLTDIDGVSYVNVSEGQTYHYLIQTKKSELYDLAVWYRSDEDACVEIFENGNSLGMISLDADEQTAVLRGISLTEGRNTVAFRIISGKADILEYEFLTSSAVKSTKLNSPKYRDGEWILTDGTLRLTDCYGKFLIGKENWGDYTVCAEVTPISDNINAGLLVRAKNPSLGEANNSVPAGINFVQGYFIGLREGSLCLGKLNYSWEEIVSLPADIRKDRSYHLEVTAEGSVITVVLDGVEVISYSDPDAFVQGCVGVRGIDSNVQVQNFTVAPIE